MLLSNIHATYEKEIKKDPSFIPTYNSLVAKIKQLELLQLKDNYVQLYKFIVQISAEFNVFPKELKLLIIGLAFDLIHMSHQPRNNTLSTSQQTLQFQLQLRQQQLIRLHMQRQNQFMIFAPPNQIAPGNHMEVEEQVENNGMDVERVLTPK